MLIEFKIPEVGENIDSGTVVSIAVSVGDSVQKDQDLFELETDKATVGVPSPSDGVIKEILVKEGDDVKIGQMAITIESKGAADTPQAQQQTTQAASSESQQAAKTTTVASPPSTPANQLAAAVPTSRAPSEVPAAPSVRRFAREIGIDITRVPGTGRGGRVSIDDVKTYAKQLNMGIIAVTGATPEEKPLPDFSKWGAVEREPMNNVRKKTAEHLSHCWTTIPHVTQFDKADITDVEKLRKEHSTPERKLTITPFIMQVMANALKKFPPFNASVDMTAKEIVYKKYCNIGVAVDTDRGLLVPVVKDVDKKSIIELTDELSEMAERARNRKTSLDELQGGSMTLTNLGSIGGTSFTPIVNWPEVAILGVSRGRFEQVYNKEKKEFVPRLMLPLSLSYDHRLIDGADGARFLRWVCEALQQPFTVK